MNIICNKISKNIGILYRLKLLPKVILKMIYNAIVAPHFDYGITVWGSATNTHLFRLFKLQKRAMRIINHSGFLAHTPPIFKSLKILTLYDLYKYKLGIFMFLCHKNILPKSLLVHFCLNCNIHAYSTRNAANFHLPKVRTFLMHNSIFYQGPIIWNSLPEETRNSNTLNIFKSKFKKHLIDKYCCL